MKISCYSYSMQKYGNTADENEDACFPVENRLEYESPSPRFAIADGATEGMLSKPWADILVESFVSLDLLVQPDAELRELPDPHQEAPLIIPRPTEPLPLSRQLRRLAHEKWDKYITNYLYNRELNNKPVQWYEEPGLEVGAFAALVGLVFHPSIEKEAVGWWSSIACGDSCLFQVRGDQLIHHYPIQTSAEFNSRPFLFASKPKSDLKDLNGFRLLRYQYLCNDRFFLATDALACWILRSYENGNSPWETLVKLDDQSFPYFVNKLRENKELKNDDTTLLRIEILSL